MWPFHPVCPVCYHVCDKDAACKPKSLLLPLCYFLLNRGSALLVGVGGSGKQSLAKFAAFVSDCDLRTVSMAAGYNLARFREEIKHVMKVTMLCAHKFTCRALLSNSRQF